MTTEYADVVIIGGGIVGCSTAYHLAKQSKLSILVLEKGELTSGSTWHAAGLVGQLRSDLGVTRLLKYSCDLYGSLEEETGHATGWKQVGGLRLACSEQRMMELKRAATTAKSFGLELEIIGPKEAQELFPLMSTRGVLGAGYLPGDGYADPSGITYALAKGAQANGVEFIRGQRVLSIEVKKGRVSGVTTDSTRYETETVVNCAGMWAREIGSMAGVDVPVVPIQHQFMVSDDIPGIPDGLPTLRDPDNIIYYKQEMNGLVLGGYEPNPIPWAVDQVPRDFGQELLEPNFEHFEQIAEPGIMRTPCLGEVGVRRLINGPEAFTPDGNFILGEAPEVQRFFVGAGFNAHGIASAGGAGKALSEWIVHGSPEENLWSADIKRFGSHSGHKRYLVPRTCELYGKHYAISWPNDEHKSARGFKKGPLYEVLADHGAVFGEKYGWERPNFFRRAGSDGDNRPSFGKPAWFSDVGFEHEVIRSGVAIIDQTSFSKIEVNGPGSLEFLDFVTVNNLDRPMGSLVYTQLCNSRGGVQADLTVVRLGPERFYLVTGTAFGRHDIGWLRSLLPLDSEIDISDVTMQKGVLNLCGPSSRAVLERVAVGDVSQGAFPFGQCRTLEIAGCHVLALRVTYVGELGWELHVPWQDTAVVYHALWEAGRPFDMIDAGYQAIESCRLEKSYLYWSKDLSPDVTPFEAGLGFCVALSRKGDFLGRKALEQQKREGLKRRRVLLTLDSHVTLSGGETILGDGVPIGVVTTGGWGYTVASTIANGIVDESARDVSDWAIEAFCESHAARFHSKPLYDAHRSRILC